MDILSTVGLSKHFGGVHALEKVDISIPRGKIQGLIGPNGSGKTTFLNVITGLWPATEGKIIFEERDITSLKSHEITQMGIARTFQTPRLIPDMSCLENVMLGNHCRGKLDFFSTYLRVPFKSCAQEGNIKQHALELLDFVHLTDYADRWARDLSWVEEQLLQLARALASNPKLLLLDEPTAGMGESESKELQAVLTKVQANGVTILVIAHDVRMITELCARTTVLCFGNKIAEGPSKEIQNDSKVLEVFLGKE